VLDGSIDSKHSLFFIRILLLFGIPIFLVSFWLTLLGKPSNNFDETFSESDMANFNFFFFGNEQVETFTTYY
jgi:hypothetical protein